MKQGPIEAFQGDIEEEIGLVRPYGRGLEGLFCVVELLEGHFVDALPETYSQSRPMR